MTDPNPEANVAATPLDHTPDPAPRGPSSLATLSAEFLGTLLLVMGGVGAALFAADFGISDNGTPLGIGFVGVSLAFGLTVIAGAYAFGPISGGHFNPAVTLGLVVAGRFPLRDAPAYIAAQLVGGVAATGLLALIGSSREGWLATAQAGGFASNGWGESSPSGFGMTGAILVEIIFTAVFVLIILGVTHPTRGNPTLAGLAIGLTLTLIHLVTIPVDNTSVNPARSLASAIFGGGDALAQLWVFLVFPIVGAVLAGILHRTVLSRDRG